MILFCIPYAGGSASVYLKWKKSLNSQIRLVPLELKGRGKRFAENLYNDLNEAVEDIYMLIKDEIDKDEYAIYGHSMGSILAYELYYKIVGENKGKPKHIFFSGQKAPNLQREREISYKLPDNEFIKKIVTLGGTPKEIVNDVEFQEIFLPILKGDTKILETYDYFDRDDKIDCNVSVLHGNQDTMKLSDIIEWKKQVCKGYELLIYEGGHFFINDEDNIRKITTLINHTLLMNNNR